MWYNERMNRISLSLAFLTLIFLPFSAHAGPILRSGETVSVDASQALKGDFYGFGSTVNVSGQGDNDVYIGGGTVTINAPVQEDLTIVGGVVQIHGNIGDDVRVIGGEVTIAKPVKGDVVVVGDTLTILSTATVDGDVLFMGNNLVIEGTVTGGVHGTVENARLNAEVGGDVSLNVQKQFTIGDKAKLLGVVAYESAYEVVRAQDAVVAQDIQHTNVRESDDSISILRVIGYEICILLFAAFTLYMISRPLMVGVTQSAFERVGISGLVGIGVFIALPLVAVLLCVSVLGSIVGIILLCTYILLLVLACALAPVFLGYALQKMLFKGSQMNLYTLCAGVVLFALSGLVYVIGGFLIFFCFIVTLGSLSITAYNAIRA